MTLEEIKIKVKNHEKLSLNEVTGVQVFMLLHDRLIKDFSYHSYVYQMHFIPVEEENTFYSAYIIDDTSCSDGVQAKRLIAEFVSNFTLGNAIFINLEGKHYEIILEVVESP
jgi:hypothetical protein